MFRKSPKSRRKDELHNQINVLPTLSTKCFICDELIRGKSVPLVMGQTHYTNASYPSKIGELVGDEFMVVVCMEDVLCGMCTYLLNHLDKLEMDLRAVRRTLTGYLSSKYNISHKDLFAKFDKGGICEKRKPTEGAVTARKVYRCELCNFSTTDKNKVEVHGGECPALPHACTLCPKRFPSIQGHAEHAVLVHQLTSACQVCSALFVSRHSLADHMKSHPSCGVCRSSFSDAAQLREHNSQHHRPEPHPHQPEPRVKEIVEELAKDQNSTPLDTAEIEFHTCAVCALTFLKASLFNEHMKMHEKQGSSDSESVATKPADVSRIEDDLEDLFEKLHAETDSSKAVPAVPANGTPPEEPPAEETINGDVLECCFCRKSFAANQELESHVRVHADGGCWTCSVCKQLVAAEDVVQHCGQHTGNPKWVPQDCGQRPPKDEAMAPDDPKTAKKGGKKFQCSDCPRSFQTRTGLSHHRATHTGQFKFCCDFCGKGFMSRSLLEEHRRCHTKEKRYVCDICGQKFAFQSTHWIHRKWHDNPYPYRCNYCGKQFKHTSLLAVHKRKHTGERPYKCPHCPVTFSVGTSLKRHIILHTGDYPYKCQDCDKGFTAKDSYRLHRAKVHGDTEQLGCKAESKDFVMVVKDSEAAGEPADTAVQSWEIVNTVNLEQVLGESTECAAQQTESLVVDTTTLTLSGVEALEIVQDTSKQSVTSVTVTGVEYSAKPWFN